MSMTEREKVLHDLGEVGLLIESLDHTILTARQQLQQARERAHDLTCQLADLTLPMTGGRS